MVWVAACRIVATGEVKEQIDHLEEGKEEAQEQNTPEDVAQNLEVEVRHEPEVQQEQELPPEVQQEQELPPATLERLEVLEVLEVPGRRSRWSRRWREARWEPSPTPRPETGFSTAR